MSTKREHFPSSPRRPPTHVMRFDSPRGFAVHGFCTASASVTFLNMILEGRKPLWISHTSIRVDDLTVSSESLEKIVEATPLDSLPAPYPRMASDISGSSTTPALLPAPDPIRDTPARNKVTQRPSKEGLVTISQIAEKASLTPTKARAVLRGLGIEKPASGWAWSDSEAKAIIDRLKASS